MGFEYIYAYLENLQWFFYIGTALLTIALIILTVERSGNNIDADDWYHLMYVILPVLLLFIILDCSPGMEHIQKVRVIALKPITEPTKGEETIDEKTKSTYYPSNYCTNSLMCSGR